MMLCKKPFLRKPVGLTQKDVTLSEAARQAGIPYPCGQCVHCRINRSRVWQHRIMLEASVHKESCFVTLTYDDRYLPGGWWAVPQSKYGYDEGAKKYGPVPGTLLKKDYQDWLKRLRYYFNKKIKYYLVGEYGEKRERPHFHVMLFGVGYDKEHIIKKTWSRGNIQVGDITKDSARYVTGYITKGWFGKSEWTRKRLAGRLPEFSCMSKQDGGLGIEAIRRHAEVMIKSFEDNFPISELKHGNRRYPLGSYLTKKFAEFTDTEDMLYDNYEAYQFDVFARNFNGKTIDTGFDQDKQEPLRLREEARHRIFKQSRKL